MDPGKQMPDTNKWEKLKFVAILLTGISKGNSTEKICIQI
jgi:hypothetical protein